MSLLGIFHPKWILRRILYVLINKVVSYVFIAFTAIAAWTLYSEGEINIGSLTISQDNALEIFKSIQSIFL